MQEVMSKVVNSNKYTSLENYNSPLSRTLHTSKIKAKNENSGNSRKKTNYKQRMQIEEASNSASGSKKELPSLLSQKKGNSNEDLVVSPLDNPSGLLGPST